MSAAAVAWLLKIGGKPHTLHFFKGHTPPPEYQGDGPWTWHPLEELRDSSDVLAYIDAILYQCDRGNVSLPWLISALRGLQAPRIIGARRLSKAWLASDQRVQGRSSAPCWCVVCGHSWEPRWRLVASFMAIGGNAS